MASVPVRRVTGRTVTHSARRSSEPSGMLSHVEPDVESTEEPSTPTPRWRVVTKRRGLSIGYVEDRFPCASRDFVLQEILELQSLGIEVNVFSLEMPDGRI